MPIRRQTDVVRSLACLAAAALAMVAAAPEVSAAQAGLGAVHATSPTAAATKSGRNMTIFICRTAAWTSGQVLWFPEGGDRPQTSERLPIYVGLHG